MLDGKTCSRCKEFKAETEFYRRSSTIDGLQSQCKACSHRAVRRWGAEHGHDWREQHRPRLRELHRSAERKEKRARYRADPAVLLREALARWRSKLKREADPARARRIKRKITRTRAQLTQIVRAAKRTELDTSALGGNSWQSSSETYTFERERTMAVSTADKTRRTKNAEAAAPKRVRTAKAPAPESGAPRARTEAAPINAKNLAAFSERYAATFACIAEPVRMQVLYLLYVAPGTPESLAFNIGEMSAVALGSSLSALRDHKLIRSTGGKNPTWELTAWGRGLVAWCQS